MTDRPPREDRGEGDDRDRRDMRAPGEARDERDERLPGDPRDRRDPLQPADPVDPREYFGNYSRAEVWWQDWRWWASTAAVLAVVAGVIFGAVAFRGQTISDKRFDEATLQLNRLRYENTCRSERAASISLPTADQTSATGRGLVIALAGDDPRVRELVDRYIDDAEGHTNDDLFLIQAEELLAASNAIDAAREGRAEAEDACRAEALDRYPS